MTIIKSDSILILAEVKLGDFGQETISSACCNLKKVKITNFVLLTRHRTSQ